MNLVLLEANNAP